MKFTTITILICFFLFASSFSPNKINRNLPGNYRFITTIDGSNKCYAFNKVAKPGKITLFVVSTHWCIPCEILKKALDDAMAKNEISRDDVEIYSYMVSQSSSDPIEAMNARQGYKMLKNIDKLTSEFPTTYIIGPTTNCYAIVYKADVEEIIKHIKNLTEAKRKYFDFSSLYTGAVVSGKNTQPVVSSGKKDVAQQEHLIELLNEQLNKKTDSLEFLSEELKRLKQKYNKIFDAINTPD